MGIFIHSFQLLERRVRINLSGCHTFVSQEFPDTLQPCPIVQHSSGKGVAKHVRRAFLHRGDPREACLDDLLHLTTRYPTSFIVEEKCGIQFKRLLVTLAHIRLKVLLQLLSERHNALLVSLTRYLQLMIDEINILIIKPYKLRLSDTRFLE